MARKVLEIDEVMPLDDVEMTDAGPHKPSHYNGVLIVPPWRVPTEPQWLCDGPHALLRSIVCACTPKGIGYGDIRLLQAWFWWHADLRLEYVFEYLDELVFEGKVEILPALSSYSLAETTVTRVLHRHRYRRFRDTRLPVPSEQRQRIYKRDGHQCVECGSRDRLTLDHIWPYSRGGDESDDNLRTLCASCNSRKGNRV